MKEYDRYFDYHGSIIHSMYKSLTQDYRDMLHDLIVDRYFSTNLYPKLKAVDITYFFNGHITIHGVEQNSPMYLNFSFDKVTFL